MKRARLLSAAAAVLAALAFASVTFAQEKKVIKRVPAANTDAGSGVEMYRTYCAVCHGMQGKGDGPAASALKQPVPDITTLAVRNHGEYPTLQVSLILAGKTEVTAHGSDEMPVWGNIFRSINSDQTLIKLRIENLTDYVGTLQKK